MDWCKKGTVGNGKGQCVPVQQKQSKANKWMGRAVGGALIATPIAAPVAAYVAMRKSNKDLDQAEKDLKSSRDKLNDFMNTPEGSVFARRN